MPKRTREEKRKADQRNATLVSNTFSMPTYTFTASKLSHGTQKSLATDSLIHIKHDLYKTIFISLAIIGAQIIFYILVKQHVLAINFVRY